MNDIHYAHAIKHCILTANTRFTTIMQYRRQEPQLLLRSISMVMLLIIVTDLTAKDVWKTRILDDVLYSTKQQTQIKSMSMYSRVVK